MSWRRTDLQKRIGCNRLSLEVARVDGPSVRGETGGGVATGATGHILLQPMVTLSLHFCKSVLRQDSKSLWSQILTRYRGWGRGFAWSGWTPNGAPRPVTIQQGGWESVTINFCYFRGKGNKKRFLQNLYLELGCSKQHAKAVKITFLTVFPTLNGCNFGSI